MTTVTQKQPDKSTTDGTIDVLTENADNALLPAGDSFSEADRHFLAAETVAGNDFGELLEKNKSPFAVADATKWAIQLLDALNYLHNGNPPIAHLDIKPRNIKLFPNGQIKLLVFGSTENSAPKQSSNNNDFHYLPLEQIWESLDPASQKALANSYDETSEEVLKQPADARSDIYSLSATLYHLLTAKLPVDALERSIYALEDKSDPLLPPKQINPLIPLEISDILMKALEIKREPRFDSAMEMRRLLHPILLKLQKAETEKSKAKEKSNPLKHQPLKHLRLKRRRVKKFPRRW